MCTCRDEGSSNYTHLINCQLRLCMYICEVKSREKNLRELGVRSPSFLVAFQMTYCKSSKRLLVNVRTCEKS